MDQETYENIKKIVKDTVVEMILKYMPIAPADIQEEQSGKVSGTCQYCGAFVVDKFAYCPMCGQELDWEVQNQEPQEEPNNEPNTAQ